VKYAKLILLILLAAVAVGAQKSPMPAPKVQFFDNNGDPLAGGKVCTFISGTPTPLATYTDYTGGASNTNPVTLDSAGRANIWLGSGTYRITLQDSTGTAGVCNGVQIWSADGVTALPPVVTFTTITADTIIAGKLNNTLFVDGVKYATVQAAINGLPTGGGTVVVPPGTYVGPTSIPEGARIVSLAGPLTPAHISLTGGVLTYTANKQVIFQYTTGLTISSRSNIALLGIIFDFQSTASITNLTLTSVSYSDFDIAVINASTANPALTINTLSQANANSTYNVFRRLIVQGGKTGLLLQGYNSGADFSYVTENHFQDVEVLFPNDGAAGGTGIDFNSWADSNTFDKAAMWANVAGFNGVVFNSNTAGTAKGVASNRFNFLDFTVSNNTTGYGIVYNAAYGNMFTTGIIGGFSTRLLNLTNPTLATYTWIQQGGGSASDFPVFTSSEIHSNRPANGTPGYFWDIAGVNKWKVYVGASNELEFSDGTNRCYMLGNDFVCPGALQSATITTSGLLTNYKGIATVSNGVPAEYAAVNLTAQTAAITTTTLYAVPASGAGQYRVSWNAKVTTPATTGAGTSTLGALTIVYTDPDGAVQTITAPASIAAGTIATTSAGNSTTTVLLGLPLLLNCKLSTNITYAFAYVSDSAAQMQFNLHMVLEKQ
jgi:hypothetical protein